MDRTIRVAQESHGCQRGTRVTGSKQEDMQSGSCKYYQTLPPTRLQGPSHHGGAEDPDELPPKPDLDGDQLMEAQTTQLQQILEGAEGTFRDEPGLTTGCEDHIKTGDALPI